jgi:hypothetical protein
LGGFKSLPSTADDMEAVVAQLWPTLLATPYLREVTQLIDCAKQRNHALALTTVWSSAGSTLMELGSTPSRPTRTVVSSVEGAFRCLVDARLYALSILGLCACVCACVCALQVVYAWLCVGACRVRCTGSQVTRSGTGISFLPRSEHFSTRYLPWRQ